VLDDADDFVAGNDLGTARRQVAFDDVEVGSADAAGSDADAKLAMAGLREGKIE
jgi:hypothetical protein